jgi:FG-GAP-like repeat/FG-GAP repeat
MEHFRQRVLRSCFSGVALAAVFAFCSGGELALSHDQPLKYVLATKGLPQDGIWKSTPVFADINEDGFLDLAALPRLGKGAQVWLGDGKGTWREASEGLTFSFSCGGGVAFGDVNKDGHLDLAVADHCAGVFVYLGDGQGHWKASTQGLNPAISRQKSLADDEDNRFLGAEDLALGDVNEDGFVDLVVAASDEGGLSVYFGDGSGKSWKEASSDGLPSGEDPEPGDQEKAGWANKVLLHDMDGDGHLDVVASYHAGPRVWRGDGKGHWQPYSQGLPSPIVGGIFRELAVANTRNGPEVYWQTKDGTWQSTPVGLPSLKGGAMGLALGDLDRDGHLDLVIGGRRSEKGQYGLFVFRGDGKGGWTEVQETNLPATGLPFTWGVALGDVNGDGLLDCAVSTGAGPVGRQTSEPQPDNDALPRIQVWLNRY